MSAVQAPQAPPRQPAPVPVGALAVGTLLVVGGLLWLGTEAGLLEVSWRTALALAVLAVGALLLLTARARHAGGLVPLGIVLSVLLLLTSVLPGVPVEGGVGNRDHRPGSAAELQQSYELGTGTLVLDLRGLDGASGAAVAGTTTEVQVGMGEIQVRLPEDLAVDVRASAGTGEVDVLGTREDGLSPEVRTVVGDGDALVLELHVGLGNVEVTR